MAGLLVLVGSDVPVGYTVPPFPSLHLPIGSAQYHLSFLYHTYDIWRFTMLWTLIFYEAFALCAVTWATIASRKISTGLMAVGTYALLSGIQGMISGSITGLMLSAIYRSGLFAMSTWIPFIWGLVQVVFLVISSYSMMAIIL